MARAQTSAYNFIAAFVDLTAAERVIEALKAEGVPGADISLLGRSGDQVVTTDDRTTKDQDSLGAAVGGTLAGALGGGVLGGSAGFLIGLAALAIPGVGPVISAGVWGAAALGAIAGAEGGALVGYVTGTELSSQRSAAYDAHLAQGHVLVGVHAESAEELEHAFNVVARSQPLEIDRYGTGTSTRV